MDHQYILHCEDTIESIFSAIYDGFVLKKQIPEPYRDTIQIGLGDSATPDLFSQWIELKTNPHKADLTVSSIHQQLGEFIYSELFRATCHYDPDRATIIFQFLVRAFKTGPSIIDHLSDPYVMRIMEMSRKCGNESHLYQGFVRFHSYQNILYSCIEPKCFVLPLIAPHFSNRFPLENWIIFDKAHDIACIHPHKQTPFFTNDTSMLKAFEGLTLDDPYQRLWNTFFQSIAIKERFNPVCQNNHIPKWFRKNMTEFNS